MPRPILATVIPSAVQHNLQLVKRHAPKSKVWAVVKANAYGHGIQRILGALATADGIALLDLNEAVRVRESGWTKPILLLEGIFEASDLEVVDRYRLTVAVHSQDQLDLLSARTLNQPINVYLKMNTGMNRLGFRPDAFRKVYHRIADFKSVATVGLMSHFAVADEGEIDWQMNIFDAATEDLRGPRSLSNSAGVLWHPRAHRDWVRPGTILYGASPTGATRHVSQIDLRPAMVLESRIISVQEIGAGETVGYGRTFRAEHTMRTGIVACGYADGYPRHAQTGTPVAVDGVICRTVGRVSMDMLTVDLTPCPTATVGSRVELWGNRVKVDAVAEASGTIGYELMCALARRVPVAVETEAHSNLESDRRSVVI
jgi:alanine racemase